jgi:hypothetical protein
VIVVDTSAWIDYFNGVRDFDVLARHPSLRVQQS